MPIDTRSEASLRARGPAPATGQESSIAGRRDALGLGLLTALAYGITYGRYGYFRDELYYLANAEHLDWGYVDHPPMIGWVTALVRATLGDSLAAIRVVPVLAGAATVALVVLIARDLGAGRYGRWLAGAAALLTPGFLGLFSFLSMNALDVLLWTATFWLLLRILDDGDPRLWLAFGLVVGLGLLTKLDFLLLAFGIVTGLLLGGRLDLLRGRWTWAGRAVAAALFLPYLIWQVVHGWPTLEFMQRAATLKNVSLTVPAFLGNQVLMAGPVNFVILLAGVGLLLVAGEGRWRPLGIAWLVIFTVLLLTSSKPYYPVPSYGIVLAAGAVAVEGATRRRHRTALRGAILGLVVVVGAALAPLARPILPVDTFPAYAAAFGVMPSAGERHELADLPQHFADRFGWRQLAVDVAGVHASLSPDERARACVFGANYGQAGAVDLWRHELGLPPAISGHNSYWIWGPGDCSGELVIVIGAAEEDLRAVFEDVELAIVHDCGRCMPYEDDKPIWVARRPRMPLEEMWPGLKNFI